MDDLAKQTKVIRDSLNRVDMEVLCFWDEGTPEAWDRVMALGLHRVAAGEEDTGALEHTPLGAAVAKLCMQDVIDGLVDFEREVLHELSLPVRLRTIKWGAAVGAALGELRERQLINVNFELTAKGHDIVMLLKS